MGYRPIYKWVSLPGRVSLNFFTTPMKNPFQRAPRQGGTETMGCGCALHHRGQAFLAIQPAMAVCLKPCLGICGFPVQNSYLNHVLVRFPVQNSYLNHVLGNTNAGERDTISLNMLEILILY